MLITEPFNNTVFSFLPDYDGPKLMAGKTSVIDELLNLNAKKTAMPAGFVTSSGNVYAYINNVATIRFTVDEGNNFGKLTEKTICVFINPEDAGFHTDATLNLFNLAYELNSGTDVKYKNITDPQQLPPGAQLKLVRKINDAYLTLNASFMPAIGKIPVEKWSNDDISGTHTYLGQPVASLIPTRSGVMFRMKSTGQKCGKDESYFADLERMLRG